MTSERDIAEAAARGVAILVYYRNGPKTEFARELMTSEIRDLALWAGRSALHEKAVRARIVESVQVGLLLRYSGAEAGRLLGEFIEVFESRGVPMFREAQGS